MAQLGFLAMWGFWQPRPGTSQLGTHYPFPLACFLRAAQYFFIRPDRALRAAADIPLRCRRGLVSGTADAAADFGGRPRRLVGPCRASIALFSLSRSATSSATICSVGIRHRSYHFVTCTCQGIPDEPLDLGKTATCPLYSPRNGDTNLNHRNNFPPSASQIHKPSRSFM